jgi:hypothetical protein
MIEKNHSNKEFVSNARFSDCEKYRYTLTRTWSENKGRILFIGLNPSTADEVKNDPTVTRMINFAKSWGYGSATVCNIFAFRATFPSDLKKSQDPIGKENDKWIAHELNSADKVIAAWGNHGKFLLRSNDVLKYLKKFHHFGLTKQGEPRHVLYLRNDASLIAWK